MSGNVAGPLVQLLGEVCRDRRTGAVRFQQRQQRLRLFFRDGRIVDVDSRAEERPTPEPDDPDALAVHEVFEGIGMLQRQPGASRGRRERLLVALSWPDCSYFFDDGASATTIGPDIGLSTGRLIAEVVRRLGPLSAVRVALGDEGRILVPRVDTDHSPEPLTLMEGELLRRVDGTLSITALLAPHPAEEAARGLLCLLLRGFVRELPSPPPAPRGTTAAVNAEPLEGSAAETKALVELRREIQKGAADLSHKSHFEVLGVAEVTSPAGIDEAYRRLSRRLDAVARAQPSLDDVRADVEALRLRVEGAYRVLGQPASRAAYEAELTRRTQEAARRSGPRLVPNAQELGLRVEERMYEAEHLLARDQCWDAMQLLEGLLPILPRGRQKRRAQILLARACLRNPKWARRAEELLQAVVREDPASVDAYLALGTLYKTRGLQSRAATMFRKVLELKPGHPAAALELPSGPIQRLLGRH